MSEKPKRSRVELSPEEREYKKFRTGYTYEEVSDMVWHREEWHQAHHTRRRHAVLGLWREIKQEMWHRYQNAKLIHEVEELDLEHIPF